MIFLQVFFYSAALRSAVFPLLLGIILLSACDRQEEPISVAPAVDHSSAPLNYHALVIGISAYSGTGWSNLNTAESDARAIAKILRTRYGFSVDELIGKQATRGNIFRKLDQLMALTEQDALLIYFAGHGYYDKQMNEGYWIPYGAQRENMNQLAKDEWLWNCTIARIIDALKAKHVLLIADTCYSGSLFRGEETHHKESDCWYNRAMALPSRYLITSGDLEPVLDNGIRHSVFAQQIINYLQYTDKAVFSASDLATAIRVTVSELTSQLVRMGRLNSPADAGGEFVFVQTGVALSQTELDPEMVKPIPENERHEPAKELAEKDEPYATYAPAGSFVRPRVVACIGPKNRAYPAECALVRAKLYESLEKIGGCIIVERQSFAEILQERRVDRSSLADSPIATENGKLLPASLIIFAEFVFLESNKEILLRMVDTKTGRVVGFSSIQFADYDELDTACDQLARKIMGTINSAYPLEFKAVCTPEGMIMANWGAFHGAQIGYSFEIVTRINEGTVSEQNLSLGIARVGILGEEFSILFPEWNSAGELHSTTNLWLKMRF